MTAAPGRDRSARPARPAGTGTRRPAWPGELLAAVFLLVGYDRVADLAQLHPAQAVTRGRQLLRVEAALHLSVERRLDVLLAARPRMGELLSAYYDLAHGTATLGVLAALYVLSPRTYRPARTALLGINLVALLVFLVLPVAPPRLLPDGGFVDVVARSGTWGAWTTGSAVARHADQYASLPSLHVAWAVWVLLAVRSASRSSWARAVTAGHLAVTLTVVLATGNHYVLDEVAGALLALSLWWLPVSWLSTRTRQRSPCGDRDEVPGRGRVVARR